MLEFFKSIGDLFKSRKFLMVLLGTVVVSALSVILKQLGVSAEITQKILTFVAGLFGVDVVAHTVTDVTALIKNRKNK